MSIVRHNEQGTITSGHAYCFRGLRAAEQESRMHDGPRGVATFAYGVGQSRYLAFSGEGAAVRYYGVNGYVVELEVGDGPTQVQGNTRKKLDAGLVREIRVLGRELSAVAIGEKFGVCHSTVSRILTREIWNHVV